MAAKKKKTPTKARATTKKKRRQERSPLPTTSPSTLKRPANPMPPFVKLALDEEELMEAFGRRPPFQQNDWLGWIARAKQEATKARRLASMLKELRQGHGYMGMVWNPP